MPRKRSKTPRKMPVAIKTEHGEVAWKEITLPKPAPVAAIERELNPAELAGLERDAKAALKLVGKYVPPDLQEDDLLLDLDLAFSGWLNSDVSGKESAATIIRQIGAAYGKRCIKDIGMRWAMIKDEHGTDIALVREDPTARSFPFTSIQYRIEDKKDDFIFAMYASLRHVVERAGTKKAKRPARKRKS